MSRSKIVFYGTDESETERHELYAYGNSSDEIYIEVNDGSGEHLNMGFICLDIETAVSLVKNLKREIGLIKQSKNGRE